MSKCPFHKLRSDLPTTTERIAKLPVDERGYPVPYFVAEVNGKPDFRLTDPRKIVACVRQSLCWVCGQPLGKYRAFLIGPMCAINRVSSEPPSHRECAEWSARACPFLTRPNMVRREDETTAEHEPNVPGVMIKRNPGAMALWITHGRGYHLFKDGRGGVLFGIDAPQEVTWWKEGRTANRAEILESIASGYPALQAACEGDPKQLAELDRQRAAVEKYLPAE